MNRKKIAICALSLLLFSSQVFAKELVEKDTKIETKETLEEKTELDAKGETDEVKEEISPEEAHRREKERLVNMFEKEPLEKLSTSYLLMDYDTGQVLEGHNVDTPIAIASTTKLISMFVVYDALADGSIKLDDEITIDKEVAMIGGSSYKLKENEVVTVSELIDAAMIVSGNDATVALAKEISGSEKAFVKLMEQKLLSLDIEDATIVNATGLPDYENDIQNTMSSKSLAILTRELIEEYPKLLEIASKTKLVSEDRKFDMENTNPLLGVLPEVDGLKTGFTGKAGRCLVATGIVKGDKISSEDTRLIGITMGSKGDIEREVAAKRLMSDGFKNYKNIIIGNSELPIETVENENTYPSTFEVYPVEHKTIMKSNMSSLSTDIVLDEIVPPLDAGAKVGRIDYYLDGTNVLSTDLIVKEDIKELNILRRIQKNYEELFSATENLFN